jgi:hypothetical protein
MALRQARFARADRHHRAMWERPLTARVAAMSAIARRWTVGRMTRPVRNAVVMVSIASSSRQCHRFRSPIPTIRRRPVRAVWRCGGCGYWSWVWSIVAGPFCTLRGVHGVTHGTVGITLGAITARVLDFDAAESVVLAATMGVGSLIPDADQPHALIWKRTSLERRYLLLNACGRVARMPLAAVTASAAPRYRLALTFRASRAPR